MTTSFGSWDYYFTGSRRDKSGEAPVPETLGPSSASVPLSFPQSTFLNDPEFVSSLNDVNSTLSLELQTIELDDFEIPPFEPDEGQLGNAIPPELIPNSEAPYYNVRYPTIVYSDDYLDDPIKFEVDRVFYRSQIPLQLPSGSREYERDVSQFVFVNIATPEDEKQWYSVLSITPLYNREKVENTIDFTFEEIENA